MALVALVLAGAVVGGWFNRNFLYPDPATWQKGRLISAAYDPPVDKVGLYMNQGDGQLFAAEAMDPLMRHPERVGLVPAEQAYRYQRPLYGWLGWVGSGGRRDDVGLALILLTIAATPLLVVAAGVASVRLGGSPLWGMVMLLAPGVLADLLRCGPEILGTALLAFGIAAWFGPKRRTWLAVALFGIAGLARETMLLVPASLLASGWFVARRRGRPAPWALLGAFVPYAVWLVVLQLRIGSLPKGSVGGRLSVVPFAGLVGAVGQWQAEEWLALGVIAVLAASALARSGSGQLRVLVAAHVALAAVLGTPVWVRYLDFGRVLLPLVLASVLAHAAATPRRVPVGDGVAVAAGADQIAAPQGALHPAT